MAIIKSIIFDVDGTLTDGRIHIGEYGESFKTFDVKDGFAISQMLPAANILPIILTGRQSAIVENRMKELKVEQVYQGISDKATMIQKIASDLKISLQECAYVGDDLNDLKAMALCGLKACPINATNEVKDICDYISPYFSGQGAVRNICEYILKKNGQWEMCLEKC